jgi:heterodisulfide reductase subunit A
MDWRPLEDSKNALEEWAAGDGKVRLIRARPSEVLPGARPVVRYSPPGEYVAEEEFDLVMLSVGMVPDSDGRRIAGLFGAQVDDLGFLSSNDERVVVAGTCSGPKDISESAEEGVAAAGRAARALEGA